MRRKCRRHSRTAANGSAAQREHVGMQCHPAPHKAQAAGTEATETWARTMLHMQVVTRLTSYVQVVTRMTSNSWTGRGQAFCWPHSSVLQATRWFRVRPKIMVLRFQGNGESSVGLIRLLWTSACRKRSEQKTQSSCKNKINTPLSKAFILHNFCCHHCFPWEPGGEGPAFILIHDSYFTASIDLLPRSWIDKHGPIQHLSGS